MLGWGAGFGSGSYSLSWSWARPLDLQPSIHSGCSAVVGRNSWRPSEPRRIGRCYARQGRSTSSGTPHSKTYSVLARRKRSWPPQTRGLGEQVGRGTAIRDGRRDQGNQRRESHWSAASRPRASRHMLTPVPLEQGHAVDEQRDGGRSVAPFTSTGRGAVGAAATTGWPPRSSRDHPPFDQITKQSAPRPRGESGRSSARGGTAGTRGRGEGAPLPIERSSRATPVRRAGSVVRSHKSPATGPAVASGNLADASTGARTGPTRLTEPRR